MSALDTFKAELRRLLPHISHWVVSFSPNGAAVVAVRHARFRDGITYASCSNRLNRSPAGNAARFAQFIDGECRRTTNCVRVPA